MHTLPIELEKLGLQPEEAQVYVFLLNHGGAYPSKIASECKINRSTVYKILTRLEIKGLVSEVIKGKKQFYQPEEPRKLKTIARYQLKKAQEQVLNLQKILPKLESLALQSSNKPIVKHYAGKSGVLHVYRDHIDTRRSYEMVAWANPTRVREFVPKEFLRKYALRKERLRIKTRGIVPSSMIDTKYTDEVYSGITEPFIPHVRSILDSQFPFQGEVTMYGKNKISLINLEDANPSATIIEDTMLHDMLRLAFELSWKGVENNNS